jgi:transcriptional regulator EpsA
MRVLEDTVGKALQDRASKFARPIDHASRAWDGAQSGNPRAMPTEKPLDWIGPVPARALLERRGGALGLNEEERERFLRIVADSLLIRSHYQLFLWLQGELQAFVPHDILIGAWGDFSRPKLDVDVISALPGVRSEALAGCGVDALLKLAHLRWLAARRAPVVFSMTDVAASLKLDRRCPLHAALHSMQSIVVHGVRDTRGSRESLYLALHGGSLARSQAKERFAGLIDALIAPIDIAFGKIGALPVIDRRPASKPMSDWLDLSNREEEILDLLCSGKTNAEIAATLSISPYTVKNHVQRIFRKIGVTNRTEAAAKYNQALRAMDRLR